VTAESKGANPREPASAPDDAPTRAESVQALERTGSSRSVARTDASGSLSSGSLTVDASGRSAGSSTVSVTTAIETMRVQEIGRTRTFAKLAVALAVTVAASLFFVGGDPVAKIVLWIGVAPVLVTMAHLWIVLRNEEAYTMARVLVGGYSCLVGAFCGIYFFGVFSPAAVVLPFGLYFFSSAQSLRATLAIYLTCAVSYGLLAAAVISGLLGDRGLITAGGVGTIERLVVLVLVEFILFITYVSSRASRRATLDAIERHDRVVRGLAQREALLKEARQELERALAFGGMGRFTDTTLGPFRLGKVIGRGAMGEVYEATHGPKSELAAVKLLHAHALADPDLLKRFLREAKIAASLDTPHVVRVIEIGGLDAPLPYIAMERLFGEDLADHFRAHRQLTMKKTIALVRQVGRGLEAARAAGIVHRDLNPRNIFLADQGGGQQIWKILDFGISKLSDDATQQTKDMILGTPGYMAPEQAAGKEVTHQTDLFALGAIAYRAITGRPAFSGDHMAETIYQVAHTMPPRPSEVVRVHTDVDLALAVALAKHAHDRFDGAAEMAAALEAAARGDLDAKLRERAERLLAKHPWGGSDE